MKIWSLKDERPFAAKCFRPHDVAMMVCHILCPVSHFRPIQASVARIRIPQCTEHTGSGLVCDHAAVWHCQLLNTFCKLLLIYVM